MPSTHGCAPSARLKVEPAEEAADAPWEAPAEEVAKEEPAADVAEEVAEVAEEEEVWRPGQATAFRTFIGPPHEVDENVWPPTRGGVRVPAPDAQGWAPTRGGVGGWYVNGSNRVVFRQDLGLEH